MKKLTISKIQDKEKMDVLAQCKSGTSVYSGKNCSTQAHPHGTVDPCWSDCKPTKKCSKCKRPKANAASSPYY